MKTHRHAPATVCLTAVALLMLTAAPSEAEEAGIVRLGKSRGSHRTSTASAGTRTTAPVVRGQSAYSDPSSVRTADAFDWLRSIQDGGRVRQAGRYNSAACDACAPGCMPADACCPTGGCAPPPVESCAPLDACCPPTACAPETCDAGTCAPGVCDPGSCAPGVCDPGSCGPTAGYCGEDGYASGYGPGGSCPDGGACPHGHCGGGCGICGGGALLHNNCFSQHLCQQAALHRAHMRYSSAGFNAYLRCKFGYFLHDGCGGAGCKHFGHYSVVYPVNPAYSDARDGSVYAAQGVNGPVSVPLAPNVRHTYNYGWGVPSSRLTPVSHHPALR